MSSAALATATWRGAQHCAAVTTPVCFFAQDAECTAGRRCLRPAPETTFGAHNRRPCQAHMTPPRHIYTSSLSRRDRVWGRPRNRLARILPALALFTIALLLVATAAIAGAAL